MSDSAAAKVGGIDLAVDEGLQRACYWPAAATLGGLLLAASWLWLAMAWPRLAAGGRGWLFSPRKGQQAARTGQQVVRGATEAV